MAHSDVLFSFFLICFADLTNTQTGRDEFLTLAAVNYDDCTRFARGGAINCVFGEWKGLHLFCLKCAECSE